MELENKIAFYLNRFITYNFLNETEVYQELSILTRNKSTKFTLLLLHDRFHQLTTRNTPPKGWQLIFTTTCVNELLAMADIICSLGYMLTFVTGNKKLLKLSTIREKKEKIFVYVSKIQPEEHYTYRFREFMKGDIFISINFFIEYFRVVWLPSFFLPFNNWLATSLVGFVQWKNKKPAFLVASRVKNGNFFHVLKLIALFL